MKTKQLGLAASVVLLIAALLIALGSIFALNFKKNPAPVSTPTPSIPPQTSPTPAAKGVIRGHLIYPSSFIPSELGVCAQKTNDLQNIICTPQIKDQKFLNGVGYQLELEAGEYYVYSYLDDQRAYYTEFVTCGLQYSCPSHAKIPVIITAGSVQDNILPHDWYDTSPTSPPPTPTSTTSPKTSIIINPSVFKINPNIKIIPTSTPVPTMIKINPIIKISIAP